MQQRLEQVCPPTQNVHEVISTNTAEAEMNVGMNETQSEYLRLWWLLWSVSRF